MTQTIETKSIIREYIENAMQMNLHLLEDNEDDAKYYYHCNSQLQTVLIRFAGIEHNTFRKIDKDIAKEMKNDVAPWEIVENIFTRYFTEKYFIEIK